ncbi:hypothetical protein KBZ17_05330 [Cyanobium sp. A2C-AMD]|nr:hypothetical protein [Cyanobium sp. A2C-AMD]
MSPQQAAGLLGSFLIETGRKALNPLDVIEKVAGKGRGLAQYTGPRRQAYDRAAAAAKAQGKDINSPQWQLQYFAEEYTGKHDPAPGRSLIGWTRVFEQAPKKGTPQDFARYYTGSAAEGSGYFRPGTPHADRRMQAAQEVFSHYYNPKPPTALKVEDARQMNVDNRPNPVQMIQQGIKGAMDMVNPFD